MPFLCHTYTYGTRSAGSFFFSEEELSLSMELQQYAASHTVYGLNANAYSINGTTPINDEIIAALSFEALIFYSQQFGYPCEKEPLGVLSVRDQEGHWYELHFDVSEEWELLGACDGCGSLFHNEEYLGSICLPELGWLMWEEAPW